jgi:hypothetical protein
LSKRARVVFPPSSFSPGSGKLSGPENRFYHPGPLRCRLPFHRSAHTGEF